MSQESKTPTEGVDFEASLAELEQIVRRLENGDLKLEEALSAFESGIRLSRECQQALQNAEQRVQALIEDENGEHREQPFSTDTE